MVIRHGNWSMQVYPGASYSCLNRSLPGYCEAKGAHLLVHCGIRHHGMSEGEHCQAVKVICHFHPEKIHRDTQQEERIR